MLQGQPLPSFFSSSSSRVTLFIIDIQAAGSRKKNRQQLFLSGDMQCAFSDRCIKFRET
ncbi:hypothetical protein ENTCAN_05812 [Enterobacter cancerogenus ATCC 35316]|nr:hypothetical protein ENTCAN_05812 [Enterobacter cancerogenus ATCC 35316]